jgi:hypothetical protein
MLRERLNHSGTTWFHQFPDLGLGGRLYHLRRLPEVGKGGPLSDNSMNTSARA